MNYPSAKTWKPIDRNWLFLVLYGKKPTLLVMIRAVKGMSLLTSQGEIVNGLLHISKRSMMTSYRDLCYKGVKVRWRAIVYG